MTTADLALVGAGYWGKNLARNFHALGSLHTLCDANANTLASYGDEYSSVVQEAAFVNVLADPDIKKVAIAAPAAMHFDLAKAALEAGKDVYVEKPLCLHPQDAKKLIELAAESNRILMVGHLLQYHACVIKLAEMVRAGELGRLFYITSNRLNLGKIRQEENSLWSFAPHDISVILTLAGDLPETVACNGDHYLTNGVADTTLTQLKFSSGLRAHVFVSWLNPFKEQKLTIVGSEGMAVFDDTQPWDDKLVVYRKYLTWTDGSFPTVHKSAGERVVVEQSEPLRSECEHFVNCCESRLPPKTDGREGLRVLEVLNAAQRSLDGGGQAVTATEATTPAIAYFAHPTAIIDPLAQIGKGSKIWHFSHVSDDAKLGKNCSLGQNVFIAPSVEIGSNVKIQNNVAVYSGTTIEDDVFLGPSCVLTNVTNPRSQVVRKGIYESTIFKRGATVGANATIVCGVTLGRYCFVAAGAVVTKDIPDYAMVIGVPGQIKGWMSRHGHPLNFDENRTAVCPESSLRYELVKLDEHPYVRCIDLDEELPLPSELSVGHHAYDDFARSRNDK